MKKEIMQALNWRYATQQFDSAKKVSDEDLQLILESGRLAPSSFGTEAWKFLVVENPEMRLRLREAGYDQAKITEASHVVVIARRTDVRENIANEKIQRTAQALGVSEADLGGFRAMLEGAIANKSDEQLDAWAAAQTYIALGMMLETAALIRVDATPIEGFVPEKYDELLGLKEQHLTATLVITLGYRGDDSAAARPKVRRGFDDVVEFVK